MSNRKSKAPKATRKPRAIKAAPAKTADPTTPADLEAARQKKIAAELRTNGKGRKRRTSKIGAVIDAATAGTEPANGETIPAKRETETPKAETPPAQVQVGPAEPIQLTAADLAPFLAIAPTKEQRHYLNGVYVHKVGNVLRLCATDGHRMLVQEFEHTGELSWGEAGMILPADKLGRIVKYIGKSEEPLTIANGANWPHAVVSMAGATFEVAPISGSWPDYQRVLDSVGDVFAAEREPLETSAISPKYLKSAGQVAALLGADGVFCFTGKENGAMAFTFAGIAGVVLVQMGMKASAPALSSSVAKLIGEKGLTGTLAALKAHETRNRKAAKSEKDDAKKAQLVEAAERFAKRIEQILAGVNPQLEHKPAEGEGAAASA